MARKLWFWTCFGLLLILCVAITTETLLSLENVIRGVAGAIIPEIMLVTCFYYPQSGGDAE